MAAPSSSSALPSSSASSPNSGTIGPRNATGITRIVVRNSNGATSITGNQSATDISDSWNKYGAELATRGSEVNISARVVGSEYVVEVIGPSGNQPQVYIDVTLTVPAALPWSFDGATGGVTLAGLRGGGVLDATANTVTATGMAGSLDATLVSATLDYAGTLGNSTILVDLTQGDVTLRLPSTTQARVTASVTFAACRRDVADSECGDVAEDYYRCMYDATICDDQGRTDGSATTRSRDARCFAEMNKVLACQRGDGGPW